MEAIMSDEKKKPNLPPDILHKLMGSKTRLIVQLKGPGPFQLPLLTAVEGVAQLAQGRVEIELETESAQAFHIILTEQVASELNDFLKRYFEIQMQDAPDRKN
jgi:hypothetical protein